VQRLLQIKQQNQRQELLQTNRAGSGDLRQTAAPLIVPDVLGLPGQPLDAATRASLEPSVALDSRPVRIHTEAGAVADTVRRNIVFGAGQLHPATPRGQRLLAHELTHVVQQNKLPFPLLQRACRSGAACTAIKGDPGDFAGKAEAAVKELIAPPINCLAAPEHKMPADSMTALVAGAGLGVSIPPEVHGIFVDKCLPSFAGGKHGNCSDIPGGPPTGAPPDKSCISVHLADEEDAKAILGKTTRSDADKQKVLELAKHVAHETQHARFNPAAKTIVPEAADCKLDTVVAGTKDVAGLLSEMSAGFAEFDVFFKNTKSSPGKVSTFLMQAAEQDLVRRGGENLLGILTRLQCACECGTVDTYTEKVFADVAGSWTPEERTEFQKAMTGFIPSFWPKALHKK
jgi:hypothetical protein